jgi:hypothetical protein
MFIAPSNLPHFPKINIKCSLRHNPSLKCRQSLMWSRNISTRTRSPSDNSKEPPQGSTPSHPFLYHCPLYARVSIAVTQPSILDTFYIPFLLLICVLHDMSMWHWIITCQCVVGTGSQIFTPIALRVGIRRHVRALKLNTKLRGLSDRANYADRLTSACGRMPLLRIEGAVWSAQHILTAVFSVF